VLLGVGVGGGVCCWCLLFVFKPHVNERSPNGVPSEESDMETLNRSRMLAKQTSMANQPAQTPPMRAPL
jgi:hypothetical protein